MASNKVLARWRRDPVAFISEAAQPRNWRAVELYPAQIEFLRRAFTLTVAGRLPFPEMLFSAPKKSGKTALAAMCAIYVAIVIGGPCAEVYCLSNDFEQSQGRVFQAAARIIQASPLLATSAKITANRIEFPSTGATITAVANDYSGFAGANPTLCIFDELWAFVSESSHRLWDESAFSPTRKVSGRLTVTYAGFEGESELLESLYKKGIAGNEIAPDLRESPGLLCYWTHIGPAPWQNDAWRDQMRLTSRPNAYPRHVENTWVTSESEFVPMEWWEGCVDHAARPVLSDSALAVWVGVDASVKRDSTAIAVCAWDNSAKKVRLIWHRIFQPSQNDPLDFEATIERTLMDLRGRFRVREVRFDPYQMQSVAQRLRASGLPMIEFAQSVPNLTEASTNLYEIIKGSNLIAYPDAEIRLAVSRCVALETSRGWRIAKEKVSHKIDVIIALAMAALGAIHGGQPTGTSPQQMLALAGQWFGIKPDPVVLAPPVGEPFNYAEKRLQIERGADPAWRCQRCNEPILDASYLDGGLQKWHAAGRCVDQLAAKAAQAVPEPKQQSGESQALNAANAVLRREGQRILGPFSK